MVELAKDFENGIWEVGDDEYFADISHISRSMFSSFLSSPTLFHSKYVADRVRRDEPKSQALRRGTAVHLALLSPHLIHELITVEPVEHKKTAKGALQWLNHTKELQAGKMPLSVKDFEDTNEKAKAILDHPQAKELLTNPDGKSELAVRWRDKASGLPLKLKIDRLIGKAIVDVKTTSKARNVREWVSVCRHQKYDLQAAWYIEGAKQALAVDDATFVHVVVTESFDVFVGYFPRGYLSRLWDQVIEPELCRLAECYANDSWAEQSSGIVEIPFE